MGKVITFNPPQKPKKDEKPKKDRTPAVNREDRERLHKLGGDAFANLTDWRRSIPSDDRLRLAKNMDRIMREHLIKPTRLNWGKYNYHDQESFNRDLSRMRMPETAVPGRRLMAHNTRWIDLLQMLAEECLRSEINVTLEALAERLTRGTRFHPTRKVETRQEKLRYVITLWANEVDEKLGLLKTYKQLAAAKAEYFKIHMREYGSESMNDWEYKERQEKPSKYFTNVPEDLRYLFDTPLENYTEENWTEFFAAIPENSIEHFQGRKSRVESWKDNFDPEKTLFGCDFDDDDPSLCWWTDYAYMPRWFIGPIDYDERRSLSAYPEKCWGKDTLDPLLGGSVENGACNGYLVLYPNKELNRMLPYVFMNFEEGSTFEVISENQLDSDFPHYFTPASSIVDVVSKNLMARIEESFHEIQQAWTDSAPELINHPYLVWSKGREDQIDRELERLTTGSEAKE
jgi:hypothetical protein